MALPSAVTVGSLGLVVVAGVGLAAATADAVNGTPQRRVHVAAPRSPVTTKATAARHTADRTTPSSTPTRTSTPTRHKRSSSRANPGATPNVLVEVYNNTTITGLAAQKASALQSAGWNVAAVSNWYGSIPSNTVYYPPHLRGAAERLADTLHITRLRPAVAPMQFDRLTVIFTTG